MTDELQVFEAMEMVVKWKEMKEFCDSRGKSVEREKCVSCPYYKDLVCNKMTTNSMLSIVASIFDDYIQRLRRNKK